MRKKWLFSILRVEVSVAILWFVMQHNDISWSGLAAEATKIAPGWIVMVIVTYMLLTVAGTVRWQMLMSAQGMHPGFWRLLALNYIGFFFNNFMIGMTGGDVVKAFYASRMDSRRAEVVASIVTDRILGIAGLTTLAIVGLAVGITSPHVRRAAWVIVPFLVVLFGLVAVAFSRRAMKKVSRMAGRLDRREGGGEIGRCGRLVALGRMPIRRFHDALVEYRGRQGTLWKAYAVSVGVWLLITLLNWEIAQGLGIEMSWKYYLMFIPVISLISGLPITISGWGVRETMYIQLLGTVGVGADQAVALSILCWATMFSTSLAGGVLYLVRVPRYHPAEAEQETKSAS